jgi:hypothetical protein
MTATKPTPTEPTPTNKYLDGVSSTLNYYQNAVKILLDQDSCPGASVQELELFKSQFRTSAYTCRLRHCPRATIGFESDQLRREHEMAHAGGFRCTYQGCQYPPYRSSKALAAHVKSNHCDDVVPPRKSIRRAGHLDSNETRARAKDAWKGEEDSRNSSSRGKDRPSVEGQSDPEKTKWSDSTSAKRRRSSSTASSSQETPKNQRPGPICWECSTAKRSRCDKARPVCGTCELRSRVCNYPDSCDQCFSRSLECDKSLPICNACRSSSIPCSYGPTTALVAPKRSSVSEAQPSGSDHLDSVRTGVGYLEILLHELIGDVSIDSELFERIQATFINDIDACCTLGEIVDDLTAGRALTPGKVISRLWSKHPELTRELELLAPVGSGIQIDTGELSGNEQSDDDQDSDESDG